MRTAFKYGVIFAVIHLIASACIVILAMRDVDNSMLFLAIDFPVTMLIDLGVIPSFLEAMSFPRDAGMTPFVVLGTVFYASVGTCMGLGVTRWRRMRSRPPGACKECGYDLTGNTSGVCPEMGMKVCCSCA